MAVKNYEHHQKDWVPQGAVLIAWLALASGDQGEPFNAPWRAEVSIQAIRRTGATSTTVWQGTNVTLAPVGDFIGLTDPGHTLISTTGPNEAEQCMQNMAYQRPAVTVGDGTVDVWAMFVRSGQRG